MNSSIKANVEGEIANQKFTDKLQLVLSKAGPLIALLVMIIFLSIKTNSFLTVDNFINIIRQAASNSLVAIGMFLAILTGGIDLSVGATMALSMVVMGLAIKAGFHPLICILVCVTTGCLLGLLNGLALTKLKLPHPFISTMGTQNIYRGLCLILTLGTPISGMPEAIKWMGSAHIGIIPVSLVFVLVIYALFAMFLAHSPLGRRIYAVGGNRETARLAGVNVDFTLCAVYSLSGLMCGLAGLILAGRVDAVYPMAGVVWESDAIAAVIIGGASFFGGRGTIAGTFTGVILIAVLRNGLNLLRITPDWQTVVLGSVIILAVFLDVVRNGDFKRIKRVSAGAKKAEVAAT